MAFVKIFFLILLAGYVVSLDVPLFPGVIFGCATSAYQIEGNITYDNFLVPT
jgi:hypothetical protein